MGWERAKLVQQSRVRIRHLPGPLLTPPTFSYPRELPLRIALSHGLASEELKGTRKKLKVHQINVNEKRRQYPLAQKQLQSH
jgi:hypothetical protein